MTALTSASWCITSTKTAQAEEQNDVIRVVELERYDRSGGAVDVDTEGCVVEDRVGYIFALDGGEEVAVKEVRTEELVSGGEVLVYFCIDAAAKDEIAGG